MRLTIRIIATIELSAFSVSKTFIFSASKSPKPKSNNNFHFSHLLSVGLVNIYRKDGKFKNSVFLRYLESVELFHSELLCGSIYPSMG